MRPYPRPPGIIRTATVALRGGASYTAVLAGGGEARVAFIVIEDAGVQPPAPPRADVPINMGFDDNEPNSAVLIVLCFLVVCSFVFPRVPEPLPEPCARCARRRGLGDNTADGPELADPEVPVLESPAHCDIDTEHRARGDVLREVRQDGRLLATHCRAPVPCGIRYERANATRGLTLRIRVGHMNT